MITFQHFDYPKTEIAKNACVSYTNLQNILPDLIKKEIIIETRKIGKARMFRLNTENVIAKELTKMHWFIIKTVTAKEQGLKTEIKPMIAIRR